eukprot:gene2155-18205_t
MLCSALSAGDESSIKSEAEQSADPQPSRSGDFLRTVINARDSRQQTPLLIAAARGHTDCVRFLLSNGANRSKGDAKGNTPLHVASARGFLAIILMLATEFEEDEEELRANSRVAGDVVTCPPGTTPLHLAACRGHMEICRILLKYQLAQRLGYVSLALFLRPSIPIARLFSTEERNVRFYGPPQLKVIAAAALNKYLVKSLDLIIEKQAPCDILSDLGPRTPTRPSSRGRLAQSSPTPLIVLDSPRSRVPFEVAGLSPSPLSDPPGDSPSSIPRRVPSLLVSPNSAYQPVASSRRQLSANRQAHSREQAADLGTAQETGLLDERSLRARSDGNTLERTLSDRHSGARSVLEDYELPSLPEDMSLPGGLGPAGASEAHLFNQDSWVADVEPSEPISPSLSPDPRLQFLINQQSDGASTRRSSGYATASPTASRLGRGRPSLDPAEISRSSEALHSPVVLSSTEPSGASPAVHSSTEPRGASPAVHSSTEPRGASPAGHSSTEPRGASPAVHSSTEPSVACPAVHSSSEHLPADAAIASAIDDSEPAPQSPPQSPVTNHHQSPPQSPPVHSPQLPPQSPPHPTAQSAFPYEMEDLDQLLEEVTGPDRGLDEARGSSSSLVPPPQAPQAPLASHAGGQVGRRELTEIEAMEGSEASHNPPTHHHHPSEAGHGDPSWPVEQARGCTPRACGDTDDSFSSCMMKEGGCGVLSASTPNPLVGKMELDLGEDDEIDECGVCLEATASVLISPCSHAICGPCAKKMCSISPQKPSLCPFCRSLISKFSVIS